MTSPRLDPGSFRDREGRVFYHHGRVCRALSPTAAAGWDALHRAPFYRRLAERGAVVATERPSDEAELLEALRGEGGSWAAVLEHERVPFVSYPYEWPFSMLRDAALGQLDLLSAALGEGFVLKDATPYNTQWRGARPTFIDVVSFEPWKEGDPWVGYLQFCRLFLYPLLLTAYRGVAFHPWLQGSIDGIEPEEMSRILHRWRDRLRPGVFKDVYLQAALQGRDARAQHAELKKGDDPSADEPQSLRQEIRQAGFGKELILANVRRLRKIVSGLAWRSDSSQWADYTLESSYDQESRAIKESFVEKVAAATEPDLVWDVGSNTGTFSRIAAEHARYVLALDADHLAVERLYRQLREEGNEKILPLVVDLANPSPGLGWRLRERRPLADRGRPDLVLVLAVIHHLVLTANIPLPDFVDWLIELEADAVLEFVTKEDPMVRRLLRNKIDIYDDYRREVLETCLAKGFDVAEQRSYHRDTRILYHLKSRRKTILG